MNGWIRTLDEVSKGWLTGPSSEGQIPCDAPTSRRFGKHKHKIRLIGDFVESAVNASVAVLEAPLLRTVDVACAAIAPWFGHCKKHACRPELKARTCLVLIARLA